MLNSIGSFLKKILTRSLRAIGVGWLYSLCWLLNQRRRLLRARLPDYVVITLDGELSEREPSTPWWYDYLPTRKTHLSFESLNEMMRRIADDPDVKGVVFLGKSPSLSLAQAQSLMHLIDNFRRWDIAQARARGVPPQPKTPKARQPSAPEKLELRDSPYASKTVLFHLEQVTRPLFMAACAADFVTVTPLTSWDIVGVRSEPIFFKRALDKLGIEMEVIRVSPWKTAMDSFTEESLSEESRQQTTWLLDQWYKQMVAAIQIGRRFSPETVKGLIDGAPWTAQEALQKGLVDGVVYEDQLAEWLGVKSQESGVRSQESGVRSRELEGSEQQSTGGPDEGQRSTVSLKSYERVRKLLYRWPRGRAGRAVGVISLQGSIMMGTSRAFPAPLPIFGEQTAGSGTLQQMVRAAREDEGLAAVILHIDSPGGSALASDLIWRELALLNREKPLIAYMGDVAASGGYYVATPARKIVAKPATLTGSIGVVLAKLVNQGLYDKIGIQRAAIQRGANAGIESDATRWNSVERAKMQAGVEETYHEFKKRVAEGRQLDIEGLDAICNGRVWTGFQAFERKLVDALGDFHTAVELACEAAQLPTDGTVDVVNLGVPKRTILAQPFSETVNEWTALGQLLLAGELEKLTHGERIWMLATGLPRLK